MAVHTLNLKDGSTVDVEAPRDTPISELLILANRKKLFTTPDSTRVRDEDIARRLAEFDRPPAEITPTRDEDDGTALGRGISRGIDSLQQSLGSAVEGVGGILGLEGLEKYGADVALANEAQLQKAERNATRRQDVEGVGTGLSYVGELVGESAPQMGIVGAGSAAGAAYGAGAGAAFFGVGAVPGALIGGAIGGTLAAIPLFFGSNRERQKEAIERGERVEISEGAAALTAIPQAALDSILTAFIGAKFFAKPGLDIAGGLFTRSVKGAGKGVLQEVPTEVGQALLERAQAGLSITSEEAVREYGEAAIAAGILGGGIGGVSGAAQRSKTPEEVLQITDQSGDAEAEGGIAGLLPSPAMAKRNVGGKAVAKFREWENQNPEAAANLDAAGRTTKIKEFYDELDVLPESPKYVPSGLQVTGPEDLGVQLDEGTGQASTRAERVEATTTRLADEKETRSLEEMLEKDRIEALKTFRYTKKDREKIKKKKEEADKVEIEAARVQQELDEMIRATEDDTNVAVRKARAKRIEEETEALGTVAEPEFNLDAIVRASTEETATGKLDTDRAKQSEATRTKILQDTIANAGDLKQPKALQNAFEAALTVEGIGKATATPAEVASLTKASNVIRAKTPVTSKITADMVGEPLKTLKDPRQETMDKKVAPKPVEETQASLPTLGRKRDFGTAPVQETTAEPTVEPRIIDTALFDKLGVPLAAPIRKRVIGKDFNDTDVRKQFVTLAENKNTSVATKTKINRELEATPEAQLDLPFARTRTKRAKEEKPDVKTKKADSKSGRDSVSLNKRDVGAKPKGTVSSPADATKGAEGTAALGRDPLGRSGVEPKPPTRTTGRKPSPLAVETRAEILARETLEKTIKLRKAREAKEAKETKKARENLGKGSMPADKSTAAELKAAAEGRSAVELNASIRTRITEFFTKTKKTDADKQSLLDFVIGSRGYKFDQEGIGKSLTEIDNIAKLKGEKFKLPATVTLDLPVDDSVTTAAKGGDLKGALEALAATAMDTQVSKLAKKLAENVGSTTITVRKNLRADDGELVSGYFDPETNAITLDEKTGASQHTILHEMLHAVTSATIADKLHPLTKKLNKIFEGVKEQLAGEYGVTNLDEFVAEAFANPDFQTQLKTTTVNGSNPFLRLIRDIANYVRTLFKRPNVPETSTFDAVDKLVQDLIVPTYDGRAASKMYMRLKKSEGAGEAINDLASKNAIKVTTKKEIYDYIQLSRNFMGSKIPVSAKKVWLRLQPVNILAELSESRIPGARELNVIINNMSASLRKRNESLDPIVSDLKVFRRKSPKKYELLQSLVPNASYERIDPRKNTFEEAYAFKAGDRRYDPKNALKIYKDLRAQYKAMGKDGQDLYSIVTNTFEKSLKDVVGAIDANLAVTLQDGQAQKRARDKLAKLLNMERGFIKPYAPLTRLGNYRLQYNALDPKTGLPETFVEYFRTVKQRERAKTKVLEYNKESLSKLPANDPKRAQVNVDMQEGTASGARNYDDAPSASFVGQVVQTLKAEGADQKLINRVVDLAIDTMPPRSFMQAFRVRGDTRGFGGDVTPTKGAGDKRFFGLLDDSFDLAEMVQNKGRDYNRQLVQMEYGAIIQKFRNEVLGKSAIDPKTSDDTVMLYRNTMDEIAAFAQSPDIPRWSQSLTAAGYAWTMGWNLSSAAITTFDVFMSTAPRLMGKYGDANTMRAIGSATAILAKSPKFKMVEVMGVDGKMEPRKVKSGFAGFSIGNYDYTDPNLSQDMQDIGILAEEATNNAQINQSLNQEELDMGNAKDVLEKINSFTSFLFHHSERYNREVAMTANYMLELNRMKAKKGSALTTVEKREAAMVAINETQFTLGATASAGRPVYAQKGIGNVAMLFKRFAISKYHMMATMTNDAFQAGGDAETRANRKIAQGQLARFLISTGMFAGVAGLPLMGAVGMIYDAVHDDSEDDFDAMLRKTVGEGFYKGIVNEALGVDVASRIGMNSLLYRPPIIDKDQAGLITLIEQLGGPIVGIYMSFDRGYDLFAEGENLKGVEAVLPAALRNVVKGGKQIATGEVSTRRGDAVVEDIGVGQILGQFAGFANEDLIQQYDYNKNERRKKGYLGKQRTTLLRKANIAAANGDSAAYKAALQEIRQYNADLPRAARGKNIILMDTIKKSRKAFNVRTGKMIGGIEYSPMMRQSLEEYDQGIQLFN